MANYIIDRIKPKYCTWPDILYEKIMNLENASESLILPKSREEVINYLKFWNRTSLNNNSSIDVIQYEELIYYEIEYFNDEEIQLLIQNLKQKIAKTYKIKGLWIDNLVDKSIYDDIKIDASQIAKKGFLYKDYIAITGKEE